MALQESKFHFTAVTGFFQQDESVGSSFEETTLPGLGLIDRVYETDENFDPRRQLQPWERFVHYLNHLNRAGNGKAVYKLIYAARHGEGYHNVKEAEVGTIEWDAYWSKLDGDGKTTWADAHLTARGIGQALAMRTFWADAATSAKLPLARSYYASPLARCLETCEKAFTGLTLPANGPEVPPFKPIIKEMLREELGVHTCDRRRTRTWIHDNHPLFAFEDGFAEQDELWVPEVRETPMQHAVRVEAFLNDLFALDSEPVISVTAHSGTIQALCAATGHPKLMVAPGHIVPFLIMAELISSKGEAEL